MGAHRDFVSRENILERQSDGVLVESRGFEHSFSMLQKGKNEPKNRIDEIHKENGTIAKDMDAIKEEALKFLKSLLVTRSGIEKLMGNAFLSCIPVCIIEVDNTLLNTKITFEEVK